MEALRQVYEDYGFLGIQVVFACVKGKTAAFTHLPFCNPPLFSISQTNDGRIRFLRTGTKVGPVSIGS